MIAWLTKLGTLISQSVNALLLGGHPDMSVSTRAWLNREDPVWSRVHAWADALFGAGHCFESYLSDVRFAEAMMRGESEVEI